MRPSIFTYPRWIFNFVIFTDFYRFFSDLKEHINSNLLFYFIQFTFIYLKIYEYFNKIHFAILFLLLFVYFAYGGVLEYSFIQILFSIISSYTI